MLLMLTFGTLKAVNCSTNSTNYQWELNIMLLRNGQVTTDNIFAPFDQVQLCSNVTYGSAPQPDSLVVFKVRGPVNAPTIFSTNATSQADCPFRLPIPKPKQQFRTRDMASLSHDTNKRRRFRTNSKLHHKMEHSN